MNDRIKELAKQAGAQGRTHPSPFTGTIDLEKFAELIIRETTRCIINSYRGHINPCIALEAVEEKLGVKYERTN